MSWRRGSVFVGSGPSASDGRDDRELHGNIHIKQATLKFICFHENKQTKEDMTRPYFPPVALLSAFAPVIDAEPACLAATPPSYMYTVLGWLVVFSQTAVLDCAGTQLSARPLLLHYFSLKHLPQ